MRSVPMPCAGHVAGPLSLMRRGSSALHDSKNRADSQALARKLCAHKPARHLPLLARVLPLSNLVLLLFSLPLTLGRQQRNLFLSLGLCLIANGLFFACSYACHYLGALGYVWFPPALAAWLPVIIFGTLTAAIFDRIGT